MHAFVLSHVILAGAAALASALALAWLLGRSAAGRWPAVVTRGASGSSVAYRDSVHGKRAAGPGDVPREVLFVVTIGIAQIVYLIVSYAFFAQTALALDLWRVRPVAVRLAIVQSVFLVPAAIVYLRAGVALLRRDREADGRARFTAGAYIAIRAMRVVAALAVASEFTSGYVEWSRVAYGLPGFLLAIVSAAAMVRAANAVDALEHGVAHVSSATAD